MASPAPLTEWISRLARWVRDLSPTCHVATQWQSRALDGRLPWRQLVGLRLHLLLCRWCRRYGHQIDFLRTALRHEEGRLVDRAEIALPAEARDRIKAALRQRDR